MGQAVAIWAEYTTLKLVIMFGIRQVLAERLSGAIGYLWTGAFIVFFIHAVERLGCTCRVVDAIGC